MDSRPGQTSLIDCFYILLRTMKLKTVCKTGMIKTTSISPRSSALIIEVILKLLIKTLWSTWTRNVKTRKSLSWKIMICKKYCSCPMAENSASPTSQCSFNLMTLKIIWLLLIGKQQNFKLQFENLLKLSLEELIKLSKENQTEPSHVRAILF